MPYQNNQKIILDEGVRFLQKRFSRAALAAKLREVLSKSKVMDKAG